MIANFQLTALQPLSIALQKKGITDFKTACTYIENIPFGRNSNRIDFELVLLENKGTCSTKNGFLASLALENNQTEIELMCGIYFMSPETHSILNPYFKNKSYAVLPDSYCFLRYKGKRYDFTSPGNFIQSIGNKIIREQRIDPIQVGEWKIKILEDYIDRWLQRNKDIPYSISEIWKDRENYFLLCNQLK